MASIDRHQYTEEIRKRAGKFAKDLNLESKGSGGKSVGRKENGVVQLNKVSPNISSKRDYFQKLNGSGPVVGSSLPNRRSLGLVSSSLLSNKVSGDEEGLQRQNGAIVTQTLPKNGLHHVTTSPHNRILNRSIDAIASFALGDTSTVDTKLVSGLDTGVVAHTRPTTDQVTPLSRLPGQGLTLGPAYTSTGQSGLHTAEMVMISSPKVGQPVVSNVLAAKVFSRQSSAEKDLATAKQQLAATRRLSVERDLGQEKILFQPGTYPGAPQENGPQIYENIESYVNPTPPPAPPPPYVGLHHIVSTGPEVPVASRAASRLSQGSLSGRPLEELYPKLRVQRGPGQPSEEIYPVMRQGASQLVVQRSASQLPGVEWRSASQLSGQLDMEVYPYLLKQRPTSQLSHAEAYPHLVKNGNRLVPLPTTQGSLSQAQLEELYPRLVQHQLSSSVQLSQLPGAQLSADLSQLHLSSAIAPPPDYENVYENVEGTGGHVEASQLYQDYVNQPPPPYPGKPQQHHTRNHSDTSGLSESSGGSQLSHSSPLRLGWYETDLDSSSDTLTPQRQGVKISAGHLPGVKMVGQTPPLAKPLLTPPTKPLLVGPTGIPSKPQVVSHTQPVKPLVVGPSSPSKPLLPFSITPPRPAGPSQAEMKIEEITRQLEEEMEKKQESEFFGTCSICNERVTGAGQACQVKLQKPCFHDLLLFYEPFLRLWATSTTPLVLFVVHVVALFVERRSTMSMGRSTARKTTSTPVSNKPLKNVGYAVT